MGSTWCMIWAGALLLGCLTFVTTAQYLNSQDVQLPTDCGRVPLYERTLNKSLNAAGSRPSQDYSGSSGETPGGLYPPYNPAPPRHVQRPITGPRPSNRWPPLIWGQNRPPAWRPRDGPPPTPMWPRISRPRPISRERGGWIILDPIPRPNRTARRHRYRRYAERLMRDTEDADDPDDESEDPMDVEHVGEHRIFFGQSAVRGEWPWTVYVEWCQPGGMCTACTGSIIHKRWILTAGHCGYGASMDRFTATIGSYGVYPTDRTSHRIRVDGVFVHPHYSPSFLHNDIALLHVARDIEFNDMAQPVCLPDDSVQDALSFAANKHCWVTGYGKLQGMTQTQSMQKLNIEPRSHRGCDNRLMKAQNSVCVGPNTATHIGQTCKGDSGGPMMCYDEAKNRWIEFALVSYGPIDCVPQAKWTTGAADVIKLKSWVLQTMKMMR